MNPCPTCHAVAARRRVRVNPWPVFLACTLAIFLPFAATTQAQDDSFDPTESYRATDYDGNTRRITPDGLGGYRSTDSEGNTTRIKPDGLGGYRATDSEGNTTRIKPTGFGSRSSYDPAPTDADDRQLTTDDSSSYDPPQVSGFKSPPSASYSSPYAYSRLSSDADAQHRSAWALGVDDRRSPTGQDEQERASQHDDSFAAASGKCGDVTTQKIGNFYYHSGGKPCEDGEKE